MDERDKLRNDIGKLSLSLNNSNHYDEADMIIRRIYDRCLQYFDVLTADSVESLRFMEWIDMEGQIRTEEEIHLNFGGE